jgi:hypothetical protein
MSFKQDCVVENQVLALALLHMHLPLLPQRAHLLLSNVVLLLLLRTLLSPSPATAV